MFLHINDKGLYLKIPGFGETRTPVKINISGHDINHIISYLRKEGVKNYYITGDNPEKINVESKKDKIKVVEQNVNTMSLDDSRMIEKLTSIETLLKKISNTNAIYGPVRQSEIEKQFISQKKNLIEDDELEFIPDIDISSMSMKKVLTSERKMDTDVDINDLAKLLSEI